MRVKEIKELLNEYDDNLEVFAFNNVNLVGNITIIETIEKSKYCFFGTSVDCLIIGFESDQV